MASQTIMVATVDGQPQVVAFALDALLAQRELVQAAHVIHLAPLDGRLRRSLDRLAQEFIDQRYAGPSCPLHFVPIQQA